MEECYKCKKTEEEVRLFDAVSKEEVVRVCGECALSENLPVIRRPTTLQLKESERPYSIYERLRRMAGLHAEEKERISKIAEKITEPKKAEKLKTEEEKKMEIEELARLKNIPLRLIDNFHWHIFMARKKKKLTRKELAGLLGESETAIKMIENKELPDDALKLVNKIEQFFGIKLKGQEFEEEEKRIRKAIRERLERKKEKVELIEREKEKKGEELKPKVEKEEKPAMILKFDKESVKDLTIADLKRLKKEKEKLERDTKEIDAPKLIKQIEEEEKEKLKKKWEEEAGKSLLGEDVEIID